MNAGRRGLVLMVVLLAVVVLAGIAVVMADGAHLRGRSAAGNEARSEARVAGEGMLRAVINDLAQSLNSGGMPGLVAVDPAGEVVGNCTVFLIDHDQSGQRVRFGLEALAGRVDVNHAPVNALAALPGMTPEIAAAIVDWRDDDDEPGPGGAERTDSTYIGATVAYAPRNAPIETLEELRLVRGVSDELYFGDDRNANGRLDPGEDSASDGLLTPGLRDLLTLESREPRNAPDGSPRTPVFVAGNPNGSRLSPIRERVRELFSDARANMMISEFTAVYDRLPSEQRYFSSRLELIAAIPSLSATESLRLWPTLADQAPNGNAFNRLGLIDAWSCNDQVLITLVGDDYAKKIIAARPVKPPADALWLAQAVGLEGARAIGALLTVGSFQFRADIVAVRNDGAGWSRLEALIDCSTRIPRVTVIRPAETLGWPFPWLTPDQLRRVVADTGSAPADLAALIRDRQP